MAAGHPTGLSWRRGEVSTSAKMTRSRTRTPTPSTPEGTTRVKQWVTDGFVRGTLRSQHAGVSLHVTRVPFCGDLCSVSLGFGALHSLLYERRRATCAKSQPFRLIVIDLVRVGWRYSWSRFLHQTKAREKNTLSETTKEAKARAKAEKAYAKASRPWYMKKRFWALGIIALIVIVSLVTSGGDDAPVADGAGSSQSAEAEEAPMVVTAQQLIDDLDANPLAAATTYEGKRVTVTGKLSNIDASGDYFSLTGTEDFTLTNVQIFIDESHLDTVSGFTMGQDVTVTGEVTSVGEVLGYSIDAETIG